MTGRASAPRSTPLSVLVFSSRLPVNGRIGCITEKEKEEKERKEKTANKKCYLLLLFLLWVMDYLQTWYGVWEGKVYYHLDNAIQWKMAKELNILMHEEEITLQRGGIVLSLHKCSRVPSLQATHPPERPLT